MDYQEYRRRGKEMVDYIADYLENIRERRVYPDVKPGYMRELIPDAAPQDGEPWDNIFDDVEKVIMPGITHWQSPYMHAYFPALNSPPSLLGDMLADALNCIGFTWASSPACTELETLVMNWLGKMLNLPDDFLHLRPDSIGGGVIQTTASESTFIALLAARTEAIRRVKEQTVQPIEDAEINSRLVAYCSDQAHSSVEKAGLIGLVTLRYIESDAELSMRKDKLMAAIENDKQQGLIPFFLCATLGTTGACAFDKLDDVGPICKESEMWLHVDAAYAGSAFICPEFRIFMKGIEYSDSIAFNPSKWLMVHFDCTAMWVKRSGALHRTFNVDPLYLKHENSGLAIDYMSVRLAQKFEALVKSDQRFEIPAERHLGMVVFRLKGDNELTEKLLKKLNSGGQLHCVPASLKGKYVIRFTVTSNKTTNEDIVRDWTIIKDTAAEIHELYGITNSLKGRRNVPLGEIKLNNPSFGSSLVLSNVRTPKIINASFVGIFEQNDIIKEFGAKLAELKQAARNSPVMRRKLKNLITNRQYSLDTGMDLVETVNCASNPPKTVEVGIVTDNCIRTHDGDESSNNHHEVRSTDRMFGRGRSKSITYISHGIDADTFECNDVITEETSSQGSSADDDVAADISICKKCGELRVTST